MDPLESSRVWDAVPHVDAHADRVLSQLNKVEDDSALPAQVRAVAKLELQVLQSDPSMSMRIPMGTCNKKSIHSFLSVVVVDADGVESEEEPVRVAVERQRGSVQVRRDQVVLINLKY